EAGACRAPRSRTGASDRGLRREASCGAAAWLRRSTVARSGREERSASTAPVVGGSAMELTPSALRPRLRGVLHQYAFFVALAAAVPLVLTVRTARGAVAATVYAGSLAALFGVSALYHRITWSARARRWMGRLDHAMIGLLIAGTFTPFGLLVLADTPAGLLLPVVWAGALGGVLVHVVWIDAPKWLSAVLYVMVGWSGLVAFPHLVDRLGWMATAL